jgi:hypothetical protein
LANIAASHLMSPAIVREPRPEEGNNTGRWLPTAETITGRERQNRPTCVATHTTRDALLLLLDFGVSVEVECDVGLFPFCYDRIYGEAKNGLLFLLALSLGAGVAILEGGDAVGCTIRAVLERFVWRIIEVFLLCALTGRGGGRGAVDSWEAGS